MSSVLNRLNRTTTDLTRTGKELTALVQIQTEQAKDACGAIRVSFPRLSESHVSVIANAVTDIFERSRDTGMPLTPFASVPEVTISSPRSIVELLNSVGGMVPPRSSLSHEAPKKPSVNALAVMSNISRGTFNSVAAGRQYMSAADLELWREALCEIGDHNNIEELKALGNPLSFLRALVEEFVSLESSVPVERIEEWVAYTNQVVPDSINDEEKAAIMAPIAQIDAGQYTEAMVKVWRAQYMQGKLERFEVHTLMDVLTTRTTSRRFSRGFQNLTAAIHDTMSAFNSRVKYPRRNYAQYKARYSNKCETGLTSEVLMGYCFYLGINPVSLLYWLVSSEAAMPGAYTAEEVDEARGVVKWLGTMSPVEYDRFMEATLCLGIVPDSRRWLFSLIQSKFVFSQLPTARETERMLGARSPAYKTAIEEYFSGVDTSLEGCDLVRGFDSYLGMAAGFDLARANDDVNCLGFYMLGVTSAHGSRAQKIDEETADLDDDAFKAYALAHLLDLSAGNSEDYLHVGEEPGLSLQGSGLSTRELAVGMHFWKGVSTWRNGSVEEQDEDDMDLASLM